MKVVWFVDVEDEGQMNETFSKIFDAPKYMVEKYAKEVLKALGYNRIKLDRGGRLIMGRKPGDRVHRSAIWLRRHAIRDRTDNLIAFADRRRKP
jgi:hypothetical protein